MKDIIDALNFCSNAENFVKDCPDEIALAMLCMFTDMVAAKVSKKSVDVIDLIRDRVAEVNDLLGDYQFTAES